MKKLLRKAKSLIAKRFMISVIAISALVFTTVYSSYVIFASGSDTVTVDGISYSKYKNGTYQYVNFGTFPKTEVPTQQVGSLNLPASVIEGTIHVGTDNNEYLYENGKWFKMEPITWRIIDVDDTSGHEKLVL